MKRFYFFGKLSLMGLVIIFYSGCGSDDPEPVAQPVADFSFEEIEETPFAISFSNNSLNYQTSEWDFGDGNTSTEDSPTHTYAGSGIYEVTLVVTNEDLTESQTQEIRVLGPGGHVTGENVITSGNMTSSDNWTVHAGAAQTVNHEFTGDGLRFTGTAAEALTYQTHVWQAVELEADQEYYFSAHVEGGGFNFAYIEIDLGPVEPVDGSNYSPDYKVLGINHFEGCGAEDFEGNIVEFACDGPATADGTNGIVTVEESGTYYFLIKAGTWNGTLGPNGVLIRDVSLAPILE